MPDVAAVRITNIVSVTQGSNTYKGVRSVDIITDKGTLAPIIEEGNLYATGLENLGLGDFPVTGRANYETDTDEVLAMLAEANASLVIVYKVAGGGANKTITIVNHEFRRKTSPLRLGSLSGQFVQVSVEGVAYSANSNTLPISVA